MSTVTVALPIPQNRKGVEKWILTQNPNIIADILEHSEFIFSAVTQAHQSKEIQDIIEKKDKEIELLITSKAELREKIAQEEKMLYENSQKEHTLAISTHHQQISMMNNQLSVLQNQLLDTQGQRDNAHRKNEQLHEEKLKLLNECNSKIEALTKSLCGTSANIGAVGESFVRHKMSSMNLGTYEDDSGNKNAGFADGTWKYIYDSPNIPQISCLVEVKNKKKMEKGPDFDKFEKIDVPAAHNAGRINMAMFISLVERVTGKEWIVLDTKLGVPTLWISRNEEDCISAETLIDVAFRTMFNIWPTISKQNHTDVESTLHKVSIHIETQLHELENMLKNINDIEKAGHSLIKKAATMKKIGENMENNLHTIRMSDSRLAVNSQNELHDFWANEGCILLEKLRDYYTDKKRHATRVEDLKDLDETIINKMECVPNAFKDAVCKVKEEIQKAAGVKRQQGKVQISEKKQKT